MSTRFLLLFLLGFFFCFCIHAQVPQKYSGKFTLSDPWNLDGKADYSYIEKNSEKIYEGKFSLSFAGIDANKGMMLNCSGTYKNGNRDGKWIFVSTTKDFSDGNELFRTGVCTLAVNYKEGQPDGMWEFNQSYKTRKKKDPKGKEIFTPFSKPVTEKIKLEFQSGVLRSFTADCFTKNNEPVKMFLTFDEGGFFNTVADSKNKNAVQGWYHGLKNPSQEDKQNIDRYIAYEKNAPDSLVYLSYSYTTKKPSGNRTEVIEGLNDILARIYHPVFLWEDLPGDLTYTRSKLKNDYLRNLVVRGFLSRENVVQSPKEKTLPAEKASLFGKIFSLLKSLQSAVSESRIDKCAGIEAAAKSYPRIVKYRDTLSTVLNKMTLLEQFYKGTGKEKSFKEIFSNTGFLDSISEPQILNYTFSLLVSLEKNAMTLKKELDAIVTDYEYNNLLKEGELQVLQKNFPAAMKAFETAKILKPAEQAPKAKIEELKNLELLKDAEEKRMKNLNYIAEHFRKIPVNYKSGEIKKHLYESYVVLKNSLVGEMDKSQYDAFKKLEISNQIIKLIDKMNELLPKDTEELEKQLKKVKEPEKIKEILGL